jgi:outer membrane protein assembly factor BamD (BamD/ComL family)
MRNHQLTFIFFLLCAAGCAQTQSKSNLEAGFQALQDQQYDDALAAADRQLQQSPRGQGAAEAWYLRGRALEGRTTANTTESRANFSAARDAYQQALRFNPAPSLEGRIHAGLANVSYWLDDFATAQSEWTRASESLTDPSARAYTLYRIGLCQQRQGQFSEADQTFARVQTEYPGSDAAAKAKLHAGFKAFSVQLATYANAATADAAVDALRRQGTTPTKTVDSAGRTVVSIGPAHT